MPKSTPRIHPITTSLGAGMKAIFRVCAVLALSMHSLLASATIYAADLLAPGDGLLTVDSASGLEWLDLTVTRNATYPQVLNSAWQGQDWRFATSDDIRGLLGNAASAPGESSFLYLLGGVPAPQALSEQLGGQNWLLTGVAAGDAADANGYRTQWTILESRQPGISSPSVVLSDYGPTLVDVIVSGGTGMQGSGSGSSGANSQTGVFVRVTTSQVNPLIANPDAGYFLVRSASAVPELGTLPMLTLGLAGLAALRARRRHSPCQA